MTKFVIGIHGFAAFWILLNGVGHTAGVLWKSSQGTLSPHLSTPSLLWVGAGLIAAGSMLAATFPSLLRGAPIPALGAVAFFAAVIAGIAHGYGFGFLTGSIVLAVLDGTLLAALAWTAR